MKNKNTKRSPSDDDHRRQPDRPARVGKRRKKEGPAEGPAQHPGKPRPVRASRKVKPVKAAAPAQTPARPAGSCGSPDRAPRPGASDQREALFNAGAVGTAQAIMVQQHEVTLVRGILLEIDGECLRFHGSVLDLACADGYELYEQHVRGWLDNHPVLRKAEVRFSGRWVHCILWLDRPIEIRSDRRRELWDAVILAVQRALPSDPEAPSLLAMTRPIGSTNSKTGRQVELLRCGEPVTEVEVLNLAEDLSRRGFATAMQILLGSTTVSPCPVCLADDSSLHGSAPRYGTSTPDVTSRGWCYHCGKVPLATLISKIVKGRGEDERDDDAHAEGAACAEPPRDEYDESDIPFSTTADCQGGA